MPIIILYLIMMISMLLIIIGVPYAYELMTYIIHNIPSPYSTIIVYLLIGIPVGITLEKMFDILFGSEVELAPKSKMEKLGRIMIKQPEMMGTVIGAVLLGLDRLVKFIKNIKERIAMMILFGLVKRGR